MIAAAGFGGCPVFAGRVLSRGAFGDRGDGRGVARRAGAGGSRGGDTFQFPVTGVQLEFHVGVTKTGEGRGGVEVLRGGAGRLRLTMQGRDPVCDRVAGGAGGLKRRRMIYRFLSEAMSREDSWDESANDWNWSSR